MPATIETIKEKLLEARREIADLLDSDPESVNDETHDELVDIEEMIDGFLGLDSDEESPD